MIDTIDMETFGLDFRFDYGKTFVDDKLVVPGMIRFMEPEGLSEETDFNFVFESENQYAIGFDGEDIFLSENAFLDEYEEIQPADHIFYFSVEKVGLKHKQEPLSYRFSLAFKKKGPEPVTGFRAENLEWGQDSLMLFWDSTDDSSVESYTIHDTQSQQSFLVRLSDIVEYGSFSQEYSISFVQDGIFAVYDQARIYEPGILYNFEDKYMYILTGVDDGLHDLEIRATDIYGNVGDLIQDESTTSAISEDDLALGFVQELDFSAIGTQFLEITWDAIDDNLISGFGFETEDVVEYQLYYNHHGSFEEPLMYYGAEFGYGVEIDEQNKDDQTFSVQLPADQFLQGEHSFIVVAYDGENSVVEGNEISEDELIVKLGQAVHTISWNDMDNPPWNPNWTP
jgi:hypothetical protein